ncbi:MAG: GNAT family N-acetyltransferase [Gammaproteobacteria bacterium]|nr:MAG: GNAT family N-acetyltransferase [Gammaproteobacteria bacterium]
MIRPATLDDLDGLVELEKLCFDYDRLSRRNFRYLLTKGNDVTLVDEVDNKLRGYAMVLFNIGTSLARLYSIAVDPGCRGKGIGDALMAAAENVALDNECVSMRLEVRPDNLGSIRLYEKRGYRQFGVYDDYYEDHMQALRYEKRLVPKLKADIAQVPYYQQTLEFTCGPASLMMAMKALDPNFEFNRAQEIRLWRESTTVFMTSGHGGCGPYGLALSAHHRGYDVEIYVTEGELFVDSVRNEEKKEVIRIVQGDFLQEIRENHIPVYHEKLTLEAMKAKFNGGAIPVVLISSYRIYQEKFPHWVVVTGFDDKFIYVHDPFVDEETNKTETDVINMPILQKDFARMAKYGKTGIRAAIVLKKRNH